MDLAGTDVGFASKDLSPGSYQAWWVFAPRPTCCDALTLAGDGGFVHRWAAGSGEERLLAGVNCTGGRPRMTAPAATEGPATRLGGSRGGV